MQKILLAICLMVGCCAAGALANYTATQGSGTTFNSFDVGGVKAPGMVITDGATGATDVGAAILAAVQGAIPDCAATPCTNKIGVVGINTWGGTALGAMANYGTSPGAVLAPGVNAFVTNTPPVSQSGTWIVQPGNTPNTTSWLVNQNDGTRTQVIDPCMSAAKVSVAISQTANTKLFSQVSAKKNYVCSIIVNGSDAENLSLVEGTGSTCGTSTAAIIGGTTAAAGMNFAANGGFARGNGNSFIAAGANNNFDVCLFQSGSGRVAGVLTYVQQ